jgi:carboxymethylenebutenolidase
MEPTSQTVPAEAIEAYNQYIHGHIDRRAFMTRVNAIAATSVAAAAMVEALTPNYAGAGVAQHPRIKTERVRWCRHRMGMAASRQAARPARQRPLSSILVARESWAQPHIEDVARRLAVRIWLWPAPTGLRRLAIPATTTRAGSSSAPIARRWQKTYAAAVWLKSRPDSTGARGHRVLLRRRHRQRPRVRMGPDLAPRCLLRRRTDGRRAQDQAAVLVHHGGEDARLVAAWA